MKIENLKTGFTLIEILISMSILIALTILGFFYFGNAINREALSKSRQGVIAVLSEARSLSLSSKDASPYGVHVEEFQIVLFKGNSYDSGSPSNIYEEFNSRIHIASHSLEGGGDEIIFSRLTGETQNWGTIVLSLKSDSLSSTTITVRNTGVVE